MDTAIQDFITTNEFMTHRTFSGINLDENVNWLSFNKDDTNGDSLSTPKMTIGELDEELDNIHYEVLRYYQYRFRVDRRKARVSALYY